MKRKIPEMTHELDNYFKSVFSAAKVDVTSQDPIKIQQKKIKIETKYLNELRSEHSEFNKCYYAKQLEQMSSKAESGDIFTQTSIRILQAALKDNQDEQQLWQAL